jgi:hypothetical protein
MQPKVSAVQGISSPSIFIERIISPFLSDG